MTMTSGQTTLGAGRLKTPDLLEIRATRRLLLWADPPTWMEEEDGTRPEPPFEAGLHELAEAVGAFPGLGDYLSGSKPWTNDAWGTPMRLKVETAPDLPRLQIVSAGKDKKFGTEDDLFIDSENWEFRP